MDLIDPNRPFDIWDPSFRVYSRNAAYPPHYISKKASVENSLICEGCRVSGKIDFSVLFSGAVVEEGAVVQSSILMPGAVVKKGAVVSFSIVAQNSVIEEDVHFGQLPEEVEDREAWGVTVVGPNLTVGKGANVKARAMLYEDVKEGETVC